MNATTGNQTIANTYSLDAFRPHNLLEKHRLETFKDWPFPASSSCSIAKMAEAGFYWTGTEREKDTATCFVCFKTLDGWESHDNPWEEHGKHAPQCEFVKLGCPEKDLSVIQFVELVGSVMKAKMAKKTREFKESFAKAAEIKLDEFKRNRK
ncbi:baculoviral IAP repeat-containing protein 5 [Drosophila tropicalis]|uniref:baculoviral IAP repeat-containing protein 5 n=1 Tax=Drosophila tropicalis TaxID=46794 RepID=UPI0035ABD233